MSAVERAELRVMPRSTSALITRVARSVSGAAANAASHSGSP
jgi:hypothetical protein